MRPEDFRASLERAFRRLPDITASYFAGIVGAKRCQERPARCDLSAGIVTDSRSRTITVHLTRPDADFLHKLTLPFAHLVPADTPFRTTGDRVPPGTGPYRVAAWSSKRGGQLVRNPHFRSSQDRPAGFADRIEVEVLPQRAAGAQVPKVEKGTADVLLLANPFKTLFPPARLGALSLRAPAQLHSQPQAILSYMFLNVRLPPFDDVRVRRALNYATDRARIVELEGGRELATPTCQILPSSFPGYASYCRYTANPGPGRGWTAPDMGRARALVAESETAGERVVVQVPEFQRDLGRYFARLLDELGYRATLRVLGDDYFARVNDPATKAQIGFMGWGADYAAPSTFIEGNFTCASQASRSVNNASYFCNRALARQVERALAAQGAESAERWAAIDHRLVDLAPAVPLTNRRSVVLVSERVGNVQGHLQGYTLLDQLWVR